MGGCFPYPGIRPGTVFIGVVYLLAFPTIPVRGQNVSLVFRPSCTVLFRKKRRHAADGKPVEPHRNGILQIIRKNKDIREAVFSETFTQKDFAHLVFMHMISSLVLGDYDCSKLLESVRRIVS